MENGAPVKSVFVSICLLTYNRCGILPRTLDSLLGQSHANFELIINDDNSRDQTESICREYERRDQRVRYFKNQENIGYANNQNAAVQRSNSDFIAIVHDGDIYRKDLIEKWTRALVSYPSAAFVFNALEVLDRAGRVVHVYMHSYPSLVEGRSLALEMMHNPDSPIFGIVMVRKSCVETVGQFDIRLPTLADVDMWLRLLIRYDAAYINEPLLQVGAREAEHHNRVGNWKIKAQHELIYKFALERLFPESTNEGKRVIAASRRMLLRHRLLWLAILFKRAAWGELWQGLCYCTRPLPDVRYEGQVG